MKEMAKHVSKHALGLCVGAKDDSRAVSYNNGVGRKFKQLFQTGRPNRVDDRCWAERQSRYRFLQPTRTGATPAAFNGNPINFSPLPATSI
jgi:hypothetical protein